MSARHATGPPLAHTGGFGEPTCRECHFDAPLNAPGGELRVEGLPQRYEPGAEYELVVALVRTDMRRAGFQLAVRFADGTQAGSLAHEPTRVQVVAAATGVQYVQHTAAGARPQQAGTARWRIRWYAPKRAESGRRVLLHVAANAANDDDSEFGDFVYALEAVIPARADPRPPLPAARGNRGATAAVVSAPSLLQRRRTFSQPEVVTSGNAAHVPLQWGGPLSCRRCRFPRKKGGMRWTSRSVCSPG